MEPHTKSVSTSVFVMVGGCDFNPRIKGVNGFISPCDPHNPLYRGPTRLSQIGSALNAPEIPGDRVKHLSIRFLKNPGYN